jgi:glycosyltransferase involved in cell wall biosynthesis
MKNWETNNPTFEFTKDLPAESSAWSGHYDFAYDLVSNLKPRAIVELGTHKGNSLFAFAQAVKDRNFKTQIHAIDTWEGDEQAGFYGKEIYETFIKIKEESYKKVDIIPHKKFFDEAVKDFKDNSIDLLHIDGLHTYEAVKHDFENWLPKVNKERGVILLHDVCEKKEDFGVYKLWAELKKKYTTITLPHSHGLGVILLGLEEPESSEFYEKIFAEYYKVITKERSLQIQIEEKDNHIRNLTSENLNRRKTIKELVEANRILGVEKNILLRELENSYTLGQGLVGKTVFFYKSFKRYLRNFFINIKKDGPKKTFQRIFLRISNYIKRKRQQRIDRNRYQYWLKENKFSKKKVHKLKEEIRDFKYNPLISIIMPVYNVEVKWIKKAIKSVRNQVYTNWELCIADDASTNPKLIKYLKSLQKDPKIKITFREKNGHISEASNTALELAEGEYIALMDNDDIIYPHALAEVVKVLNKNKETDFIYSDEDKITVKEKRVEPFFKPDWSPDLFLSSNYLCHLSVIRKKLVDKVGKFRKGFEGSQDYDLFLRVTEKTNNIEHISDILYSWRKIPGSTASTYGQKSYADKASLTALSEAIKRRGLNATVQKGLFPGSFRVKYNLEGNPLVSILIPTKDKYEYIERCISSIFDKTIYQNFEIIIIDTGSTEKRTLEYYESLRSNPKIRFLHWDKKFNYSGVNNYGVKHSKGEYILLLNNDTEVISPDWIEGMLEHAQRKEIGAVGVKLYYPHDVIQHAGVILGINGGTGRGVAGHAFKGFSNVVQGFPVHKDVIRNYSAVTAACLMISKKKYSEVDGLEEKFRIAFNDVDFCLKLMKNGYYNIYTPYVELYHHESVSVGVPENKTRDVEEFGKEIGLMYERWGEFLLEDPFYNKNLTLTEENFKYKLRN